MDKYRTGMKPVRCDAAERRTRSETASAGCCQGLALGASRERPGVVCLSALQLGLACEEPRSVCLAAAEMRPARRLLPDERGRRVSPRRTAVRGSGGVIRAALDARRRAAPAVSLERHLTPRSRLPARTEDQGVAGPGLMRVRPRGRVGRQWVGCPGWKMWMVVAGGWRRAVWRSGWRRVRAVSAGGGDGAVSGGGVWRRGYDQYRRDTSQFAGHFAVGSTIFLQMS